MTVERVVDRILARFGDLTSLETKPSGACHMTVNGASLSLVNGEVYDDKVVFVWYRDVNQDFYPTMILTYESDVSDLIYLLLRP